MHQPLENIDEVAAREGTFLMEMAFGTVLCLPPVMCPPPVIIDIHNGGERAEGMKKRKEINYV